MAVAEWDQRQLCPDGGCVGVIGPSGTCKVCGRVAPNWGDERKRGLLDPPDEAEDEDAEKRALAGEDEDGEDTDDDEDLAGEDEDGEDEDGEDTDDDEDLAEEAEAPDASAPAVTASPASNWGSRTLCPDGGCIGVIGPDGTCKVCGRAASGSREAAPPAPATVSAAEPASAASLAASAGAPADAPADAPVSAPGTPARARCSDVTCTGMIGPDGHCEVCGKVAA